MNQRLKHWMAGLAVFACLTAIPPAIAMEPFVVRDMRVEGLQRISEGTVFNYLPVNLGDRLDSARISEAIRAVYGTGLFSNVEMRRDGEMLIVAVRERPSIRNFTLTGNKDIKTEDLEESLRAVGLARGRTLDRSVLEEVRQFLIDQYYSRGKYSVVVDTEVTENESDNTLDIEIRVKEGQRARIRQISIVGNEAFSDEEILDEFKLKTRNWLSWYRQDDRYAREALVGDLEALQSYYMDRGYASFEIESTQVQISPDQQGIYITVNISEGEPYRISEVRLAGNLVLPEEQLRYLVLAKPGDTFSRRVLTQSAELITFRLGEEGYAFARVDPVPTISDDSNEVSVTLYVDPGKRAYVRRINFLGTTAINDEVLRREMRQLEGGYLSNRAVDRSEQRLRMLPYIEEIEKDTVPVAGSDDLVDVEFKIKDGLPGNFGGGVGYSGLQGVIFNANFVHTNFLGSGNRIEADVNTGRFSTVYRFLHTDPYVTADGVARTMSASFRDVTQFVSGASEFGTKTGSLGLEYSYPVSEYARLRLGGQALFSALTTNAFSPFQSIRWVQLNGDSSARDTTSGQTIDETDFDSYELILGWTYDSRNRVVFADRGTRHRVSLTYTIPGSDVEYYSWRYDWRTYFPFFGPTVLEWNGELSFADALGDTTEIPPYKRYFGGGLGTVRGLREGWMGPRDTNNNPYGGNSKVATQLEMIIPLPGNFGSTTRFSLFADAGNIFSTDTTPFFDLNGEPRSYDFSASDFKYSVGAALQWLAPIGLFSFSYAFPLNDDEFDRVERFQFQIGSAF